MKILILISLILFYGCAVDPKDVEFAEKVCKDHGGWKLIFMNSPYPNALCNDGIYIRNNNRLP